MLGNKKVNTTAHHPQTDGLVGNFNKTLQAMAAKHAQSFGRQLDVYLHQLFAYWTKLHEFTGESAFFLSYGRDARLPKEGCVGYTCSYTVDPEDYRVELGTGLSAAWQIAKGEFDSAQRRQYDKRLKPKEYCVGGRVMVSMPQEAQGKGQKLALPYCGLSGFWRFVQTDDQSILVSMDRFVDCPKELPDMSWLGPSQTEKTQEAETVKTGARDPQTVQVPLEVKNVDCFRGHEHVAGGGEGGGGG